MSVAYDADSGVHFVSYSDESHGGIKIVSRLSSGDGEQKTIDITGAVVLDSLDKDTWTAFETAGVTASESSVTLEPNQTVVLRM